MITLAALASNLFKLLSSSPNRDPGDTRAPQPTTALSAEETNSPAVLLSLSPAARDQPTPVTPRPTAYYVPFFPVREGFTAQALADAVNFPDKETGS